MGGGSDAGGKETSAGRLAAREMRRRVDVITRADAWARASMAEVEEGCRDIVRNGN